MEPAERAKGIAQIAFQLDVLEGICAGPYLAGDVITSADSALFPTVVFLKQVRGRVSAGRSAAACDCAAAVVYDHAMRQLLRPPPHTHTHETTHTQMLPDVFGWQDVFAGRPKLAAWWAALQQDPHAVRVRKTKHCWRLCKPKHAAGSLTSTHNTQHTYNTEHTPHDAQHTSRNAQHPR